MPDSTVLGLDIGGSKTHGVRADGGVVTGQALAGSANLCSVGTDEAARHLDVILDELGTTGVRAVCAGAAGAESPRNRDRLQRLLARRLPEAVISTVHDTRLILAAAELDEGVVLVSGTGSVAWGRRADGADARAGGWGYLLGDEGSGYWIATQAVRHALSLADEGGTPDRLARELAAACGVAGSRELLDQVYARPERQHWADHAHLVFRLAGQGDPPSRRLVTNAADSLAGLAGTVCRQLDLAGPVVLAGGIATNHARLRDAVTSSLAPRGIRDVRVLDADPALGAVRLAEQLTTRTGEPAETPPRGER